MEEEVSKGLFHATKDAATGSPIWLVLLGLGVTLFAAWARSNRDQINENPTLKAIVIGVSLLMVIFLIYLFVKTWPE